MRNMKPIVLAMLLAGSLQAGEVLVCQDNKPIAKLVVPQLVSPVTTLAERTINGYLSDQYGWTLPLAKQSDQPGLYIVVGNKTNNRLLADLGKQGLDLQTDDLGEEGFRIVTHTAGDRRFVIVTANTPVGLKYGCQELTFYHLPVTATQASVEWPLDLKMKPQFAYRGSYMLPCWADHDSVDSWRRVLRFNSEITVNRNWFWLNRHSIIKKYEKGYHGIGLNYTDDLTSVANVGSLIDLCHREGMKFSIGGGWFMWHHEGIANGSVERGIAYYRELVDLFPEADGLYLEPVGEAAEVPEAEWRKRTDALDRLAKEIWQKHPNFEFAIAVGKRNNPDYLRALHAIDQKRIYWWWCWGDPIADKALDQHPLVLRWHTTPQYGRHQPPTPAETALTGQATSYDPGQGFGNPWNGQARFENDRPREFHPYTIPYFANEYRYREGAWNVNITPKQFSERLRRRLFDADMPAEAIQHYLALTDICAAPAKGTEPFLSPIESFVKAHACRGTARNRDTFERMREAIAGFRKVPEIMAAKAAKANEAK
jgi:hypothetical protein